MADTFFRHHRHRRRARRLCRRHPGGPAGAEDRRRRARASGRHLPQLGLHSDQGAAALGRSLSRPCKHAESYGLSAQGVGFDLAKVVARSRGVAGQLQAGVKHLLKKNKVTVFDGHGRLAGKGKVAVDQGRQGGGRAVAQAHHPRHRRARPGAAGPGARRQAGLDL